MPELSSHFVVFSPQEWDKIVEIVNNAKVGRNSKGEITILKSKEQRRRPEKEEK